MMAAASYALAASSADLNWPSGEFLPSCCVEVAPPPLASSVPTHQAIGG